MNLYCYRCDKDQPISVQPSGPHLKAICSKCKAYLKFLSKDERRQLETEEDELEGEKDNDRTL